MTTRTWGNWQYDAVNGTLRLSPCYAVKLSDVGDAKAMLRVIGDVAASSSCSSEDLRHFVAALSELLELTGRGDVALEAGTIPNK